MSLIHELLYQTKDFSTIQFSEYIKSIATNLFHSYNQNRNIVLEQDLDDIKLDLDMAIPCGLIVNELITNALKYAFDEKEEGVVKIGLKQESELIKLSISDDGKGFPENINFRETSSLGMQLVISLVEQIDGEILLNSEKGTQYTITFNAPF
jgi:two-component sensor histidine kinase